MYVKILIFLLLATFVVKCYSIQCFTCEGIFTDLNNKTCSVVSENDSCYITTVYAVDTGNWIVSMGGFIVTPDFPGYYVKPKSGSAFFEQAWMFTNDANNHQLLYIRHFCYKDLCNPLSLVSQYLKSDISYDSFELNQNVTECVICNAKDYNSATLCTKTQSCNTCSMTANQTLNDLYSFVDWSSKCPSSKFNNKSSEQFGEIILQYEIDTKLLNIYTVFECRYLICSSFDFIKQFLKSIKLII